MLDIRPSALSIVLSLALIVPTAAVFAAILLTLSIYARSFKEAQSYMMPVQFLIIIPAAASLIPDLRLDVKTAWIPILNVALGLREVLTAGDAAPQWLELGIIFLSASLLAGAALLFCAKWFDREEVLFRT